MKPKSVLVTSIPASGISEVDSNEVLIGLCKEEAANFAVTSNVVNFDEHDDDAYPDIVNLSEAGTKTVTSFSNLSKGSKRFMLKNTGAGAKTITHGNNVKNFNATATLVLLTNEYCWCYNDGTNVYVESVHHFAAQS
jgi:hypothetical protein